MRTYKFKLYQSKKNKKLVIQNHACSHIYNHCIAIHKKYYKIYGKYLFSNQLKKHLTKMKRRKFNFWKDIGSQTIQEITERIDKCYKLFFKKKAKRLPFFKSKYKHKEVGASTFEREKVRRAFSLHFLLRSESHDFSRWSMSRI